MTTEIHGGLELHVFGMHLEDGFAAAHVRKIHGDLAVEAPGAQQRRIQDIGAVGGRDDDDAFLGIKTVHLDEQGVQGLLAFVVAAAQARVRGCGPRRRFRQ